MEQVSTPNRAGIFDGEQHSETGIPLALIDTGSRIEVEGGEFNFPEWVQTDKKIYTLTGKNLGVIKQIFKIIGASWDEKVTHVKSGDIIICIRSAFDDEERTYTGTLIQIISAVNESCGCKHVQSGATMTNHETGATVQMADGGGIPKISPEQLKARIEKETGLKVSMKKQPINGSMRGYLTYTPRKTGETRPYFDFNYGRSLAKEMEGTPARPNFFSIGQFSIFYGDKIYDEPITSGKEKLGTSTTVDEAKKVMFPLYEQIDKFEGDIKIGHTKIDWGSMPRGQGRRYGDMVQGSMSGAPRGIKSYPYIKWSMYPEVAEDIAHMKHFTSGEAERYVRARQFGANHLEAKLYALRFDPKKDGGQLAPNGKKSNLNEIQHHLVRTPEFKKWFGDWENDPENASKVVDENGEPLVVYHGSDYKINIFDVEKQKAGYHGKGFYFATENLEYGKNLYEAFLNIRNPFDINASYYVDEIKNILGKKYKEIEPKIKEELQYSVDNKIGGFVFYILAGNEDLKKHKYDGIIHSNIRVAFDPTQIKLADGSNKTFNPKNPDIRKVDGGQLPELNDEGGYEYKGKDEKVADRCGLITLPKSITGTNCSNCIFQKDGFCDHEKILLPVTKRMCCAMWSDKSLGSIISNITKADFFPDKKLKEKKYPLNENGGYDYIGSAVKKSRAVDLITLPKHIKGTSCAFKNCLYTDSNNFCTHPKIMLPVTDRMSCGWYDADGIIRPWGKPVEIDFSKQKEGGKQSWVADSQTKKYSYKAGGRVAQGYIIAPYSKLKKIFGEPNVKNEKEKIGWYMAIDKNHTGAIWTEADKSVKTIMKEKFHKWFVWGANDESQKRLYEATHSQVRDIDPEKQKAKDKAISAQRWIKKRGHIQELSNNIHRLRAKLVRDLESDDEKTFLTALIISIMDKTAERVGNIESACKGHFGVTCFTRDHVKVIGSKILLDYVGKTGVPHIKDFSNSLFV